jgi:hypothetical protein
VQKRGATFGWTLKGSEMKELNGMTSPDQNPTLFSSAGCKPTKGTFQFPKK